MPDEETTYTPSTSFDAAFGTDGTPVSTPAPSSDPTPAADPAPEAEAAPSAEPEAAPAAEPKAEVDPAAETPEGEPDPAAPGEPAPEDPTLAALRATAKALGITETDPAKLAAAITEHHAKAEEAATQTAEQARVVEEAETQQRIVLDVSTQMGTLIHPIVKGIMATEGFDVEVLDQPNWFADPDNAAYLARYQKLRVAEASKPEWESQFQASLKSKMDAYKADSDAIGTLAEKYPFHDPAAIAALRKQGMSVAQIDAAAAYQNNLVTRSVSTLNSELTTTKAQLAALTKQVSGHAEAIAKAKADGISEGRNAAMQTLEAGARNPAANGPGAPAPTQVPHRGTTFDQVDAYLSQKR